jgi:20S proteasome alpha/beta subunit
MYNEASMGHPQQREFNPYSSNGGTILAIAGLDFSVIAGDTRQSEGFNIQTRYAPKVFRLYVVCAPMGEPTHDNELLHVGQIKRCLP